MARQVSSRAALFFACIEAAFCNSCLLPTAQGWWQALELRLFDAAHFLCIGWCAILMLWSWQRFGPKRSFWRWPALMALALVIAWPTLPPDFENFAQGQAFGLAPGLVSLVGVVGVALGVPLAHAFGMLLAHGAWRSVGLALAVAAFAANAVLLPADYEGIHLFVTLCGISLAATVQAGANWPSVMLRAHGRTRRWHVALGGLSLTLAVLGLLLPEHAVVAAAHRRASGSVLVPLIGRAGAEFSDQAPAGLSPVPDSPWFRDRSKLPPVLPSGPRLLGDNPLVLLITVDALRADLINSRRYDATLPTFAKLRDASIWFDTARAAGTLTKTSLTALFMGTYFSQQKWASNASPDKSPRFPQFLQQAGVRTVNYRSIYWIRHGGGTVHGFDEDIYVGKKKQRKYLPSVLVFKKLLPRLSQLENRPYFIFSHLSDPHAPYNLGGTKGSAFERYLAEVRVVDGHLAKLLDLLEHGDLGKRTLLIVSADHGEAFGEHGARTHGTNLYDEALRVPLLMWTRDRSARHVTDPVSVIDLGPTILEAFAQPVPGFMMGQSLLPYVRGESPHLARPMVAESRLMQSWVTEDGLKLIVDRRENTLELYDLVADPAELTTLDADSERGRRPLQLLRAFFGVHTLRIPGYEPPLVR